MMYLAAEESLISWAKQPTFGRCPDVCREFSAPQCCQKDGKSAGNCIHSLVCLPRAESLQGVREKSLGIVDQDPVDIGCADPLCPQRWQDVVENSRDAPIGRNVVHIRAQPSEYAQRMILRDQDAVAMVGPDQLREIPDANIVR